MFFIGDFSLSLIFCFSYKKQINSNKNEFNGEMRNDKLWQMELKIYQAIVPCCAM